MKNLQKFLDNTIKLSDIGIDDLYIKNDFKNPNFSVIIPCYNRGKTIERTVISVLNQTLDDIEIIIVDDASIDKYTIQKLNELSKYAQVIFINDNSGVSNARNIGIKNSNADYILCLDSDDFIDKNYLRNAKNVFDSDEDIEVVIPSVRSFGDTEYEWIPRDNFNVVDILSANQVSTASCVRKNIYDDIGYYDVSLRSYEDWEFWTRVFLSKNQKIFKVIEEMVFFYSVKTDSLYHSMTREKRLEVLHIIYNKHKIQYQKYGKDIFAILHTNFANCQIYTNDLKQRIDVLIQESQNAQKKEHIIQEQNNQIQKKKCIIQEKNNQIQQIEKSKSFLLGTLFFRSIKKPVKWLTFPVNMYRILSK